MGGRDVDEAHRVATPLELLFDLTFVIAFGLASSHFAHALAHAHYQTVLIVFVFVIVGICWAGVKFLLCASAYDTDDWLYRVTTMVQMIGVLVFALGVPRLFASLELGRFDNSIMVLGYVVMRVPMILQWLRAAKQDPKRRRTCLTYVTTIAIAQAGWVALIFWELPRPVTFTLMSILVLIELGGPFLAEKKEGGTPWHAHHIAERFSLFAIIALGEGVVGTVAALSAVIEAQGWTFAVVLVGIAGTGLTFGMWWVYFMLPSAPILRVHRNKSFIWGYGQMLVVTSIVATGAGLHVAAYFIEHQTRIGPLATVLSVAIPVGFYLGLIYALYAYLIGEFDRFHLWLLLGTAVVVAGAIVAAVMGANMAICLVILMLAPVVTVVGYELLGRQHKARALERSI
jgi:low temperature requirement protein LtrA